MQITIFEIHSTIFQNLWSFCKQEPWQQLFSELGTILFFRRHQHYIHHTRARKSFTMSRGRLCGHELEEPGVGHTLLVGHPFAEPPAVCQQCHTRRSRRDSTQASSRGDRRRCGTGLRQHELVSARLRGLRYLLVEEVLFR